jgi:hypothetical protein
VLDVATRFAPGGCDEPVIVARMYLTAGSGRPVRKPDDLIRQLTAPRSAASLASIASRTASMLRCSASCS